MDVQLRCCCDVETTTQTKKIHTEYNIFSLIRTLLDRCKKKKSNNCLQTPLEDDNKRISYYTVYPKTFLYYLIGGNDFDERALDVYRHILLMECINSMYSKNELPLHDNLYNKYITYKSNISENYNLTNIPDLETFKTRLYLWDYIHKKMSNGTIMLMENPKIKFERFNYLNKIKKSRSNGKQIYYVDERQISTNAFKNFHAIEHKDFDGLLFFHIISDQGYENGIYTRKKSGECSTEAFKKWMIDVVLHTIKPSSVIVFEHNVLHGVFQNKCITRFNTKNEMLLWLRKNNIPCDSNMPKPVLYELIEKFTSNSEDYDIDRVFKTCGHEVLRLPITFPSLNPTTFLWQFLSKNFTMPKESNPVDIKDKLTLYLEKLEAVVWASFVEKVVDLENDIYEIDLRTDNLLEKFSFDN